MMNNNIIFPGDQNYSFDHGFEYHHRFALTTNNFAASHVEEIHKDDLVCFTSTEADVAVEGESSSSSSSNEVIEGDYFDGVFKYIHQMLMEEDDLESRPCMFQDCIALQAAEKSFYDALNPPSSPREMNVFIDDDCNAVSQFVGPESFLEQGSLFYYPRNASSGIPLNSPDANGLYYGGANSPDAVVVPATNIQDGKSSSKRSAAKKNVHNREEGDHSSKGRNPKQFATSYGEEPEQAEEYDKALLCPGMSPSFYEDPSSSENAAWNKQKSCHLKESKRGRPRGSKKGVNTTTEVVDLTCLLTRCAEAAASYNSKTFVEVLKKIRQHSSPFGDATARLAHCFANALEARFALILQ